MSDPLSVLVLAGGLSAEREVSLRSGSHVTHALRAAGVEARQRDVDGTLLRDLAEDPPDVVLPLLHGVAGEDGTIREVLELAGVPYVGAGPAACRAAFDKPTAKAVFAGAGLRTPDSVTLPQHAFHDLGAADLAGRVVARLGLPLFVKPRAGGSALGVGLVETAEQLPPALVAALGHHPDVLIERCVEGVEVAVAVADSDGGPVALPPVEIEARGLYDYTARYTAGAVAFHTPARLPEAHADGARRAAVRAHRALGLRHLSRTDAVVTAGGEVFVLETNPAPGMTATSSYPAALEAAGHDVGRFFAALAVDAARTRRR
ncbi:D-alanine--D-alanine ligase [Streptomyces luteireticuli]|uniref:D-alanine--D-alanine ligase family protein n=1 Tax=Streptomyces luteireticuli TaxID=173858 RepID=UPI003556E49F